MTTLETQETVNQLAARWCELVIEQERRTSLIANPQCGKPGAGFKAARKAQQAKRETEQALRSLDSLIDTWISRSRKASLHERAQRLAQYQNAIAQFCPRLAPITLD